MKLKARNNFLLTLGALCALALPALCETELSPVFDGAQVKRTAIAAVNASGFRALDTSSLPDQRSQVLPEVVSKNYLTKGFEYGWLHCQTIPRFMWTYGSFLYPLAVIAMGVFAPFAVLHGLWSLIAGDHGNVTEWVKLG